MTDLQSRASNRTIMVVDDNSDIVAIIKTILEDKGYALQFAYSGQEAFNLLGEQKPDLKAPGDRQGVVNERVIR